MLKPSTIALILQVTLLAVVFSVEWPGLPEPVRLAFCLASLTAGGFSFGWRAREKREKREKKGGE